MLSETHLADQATRYLQKLCLEIDNRCVGSRGNRDATDFFADTIAQFGFTTEKPPFDCMDWSEDGADLVVDNSTFEVLVSPYTLAGQCSALLVVVNSVVELEAANLADKVVLLRGDIAQEQLMPKNFPFYNPEEHQHIIGLLESKGPCAIIAATSKNPSMAGGVYPFPLIEDGDFDIPSVFMTDVEGERLAQCADRVVSLDIWASRKPSTGYNVIAHKGHGLERRVVVCAHIDAKMGTPGALDNGTGITTLLLLAELLADYMGEMTIEIVAINGEDYYAAVGEIEFLKLNEGRFDTILLGINLDGLGYKRGKTAYSLYGCSDELATLLRDGLSAYIDMDEGQQWYQSDHSLFVINQRPALAFTSDAFDELWCNVAHTEKDRPDLVDTLKLVHTAAALHDIVLRLDQSRSN